MENTSGFHMMFLEETNWRESYTVSFQINSNPRGGSKSEKWIIEFYIRSYRSNDQSIYERLQCEVLRRRHSEKEQSTETLLWKVTIERRLHWHNEKEDSRRQSLKGWISFLNWKDRKRKEKFVKLNCDLRSTRLSCKLWVCAESWSTKLCS